MVANGNLGNIPVLLLYPFGLILCCVKGSATLVFMGYSCIYGIMSHSIYLRAKFFNITLE